VNLAEITTYGRVNISYCRSIYNVFVYVDYILLKLRHFSVLQSHLHGGAILHITFIYIYINAICNIILYIYIYTHTHTHTEIKDFRRLFHTFNPLYTVLDNIMLILMDCVRDLNGTVAPWFLCVEHDVEQDEAVL
jgi:hypothetical protein